MPPFAAVTFYHPLSQEKLAKEMSYETFLDWLRALFPSPNIFYAIRIEGTFPGSGRALFPGRKTTDPWQS